MSRVSPRVLFGIGVPVVVVLLLLAAWAIDSSRYTGKVPRNVELAGHDIGGLSEDSLARTVADIAAEYGSLPVTIRADGEDFEIEAGELGLHLDEAATVSDALDMNKRVNVFVRPITWLSSFVSTRTAHLRFTVDRQELEAGVATLAGNSSPTEPEIVKGSDGLTIISGGSGRVIATEGLAERLLAEARSGETPIVLTTKMTTEAPTVSDEKATDFANRINAATEDGITIVAGSTETDFDANTVRGWLSARVADGEITLEIDEESANAEIQAEVSTIEEPVEATFDVVNGVPTMNPGKNGEICCGDDTAERVLEAIDAGRNRVEAEVEVVKPKAAKDLDELGIKEPVGSVTEWAGVTQDRSFTTYHAPGEARVTNIHLIADAARGTLVMPGEQFSMNDVVGQRTAEKGYVAAGAIRNGETVDEIGGGVSQFATTMFNAAYYAGLQIDVYQAHSEHFSRYPRGREATMGWPAPNLVWTNNSPHAILVWTSYTDTSITVTFYSTQWATAEQVDSQESRSGNCTVVTTTREVTYPDGSTSRDNFTARYRDKNVTTC